MIRQCAILFGCLALGELIVFFTGIKLPSSIIGMLLLTLFLKLGWIKLHWVQGMSDFLVSAWRRRLSGNISSKPSSGV